MEHTHYCYTAKEASDVLGRGPGTMNAHAACGNGAPPDRLRHATVPTCPKCKEAILKNYRHLDSGPLAAISILSGVTFRDATINAQRVLTFYDGDEKHALPVVDINKTITMYFMNIEDLPLLEDDRNSKAFTYLLKKRLADVDPTILQVESMA